MDIEFHDLDSDDVETVHVKPRSDDINIWPLYELAAAILLPFAEMATDFQYCNEDVEVVHVFPWSIDVYIFHQFAATSKLPSAE